MPLNHKLLWKWANERHAIHLRKRVLERGGEPETEDEVYAWGEGGWALDRLTNDTIMRQYRFCNVYRELDRVTDWIRRNIREPYADHPDLWLMLAIARYINWPDTLKFLMNRHEVKCMAPAWPTGLQLPEGNPHAFTPESLGEALDFWSRSGRKVYTGAYMIRAESNPKAEWYSWTKQQYVARIVIGRLWEDREEWRYTVENGNDFGVEAVWKRFQQPRYIGWGPFMAYQVVVDMSWTRYLQDAPDKDKWAAVGPGSHRGINRLLGREPKAPLSQSEGLKHMLALHQRQDRYRAPWLPRVRLSDIQNCLCETDKWLRVRAGEGEPRAHYVPGRGY